MRGYQDPLVGLWNGHCVQLLYMQQHNKQRCACVSRSCSDLVAAVMNTIVQLNHAQQVYSLCCWNCLPVTRLCFLPSFSRQNAASTEPVEDMEPRKQLCLYGSAALAAGSAQWSEAGNARQVLEREREQESSLCSANPGNTLAHRQQAAYSNKYRRAAHAQCSCFYRAMNLRQAAASCRSRHCCSTYN